VAHLGQSRRSGDVRGERYYRQSNPDMKSELAVPIMLDGAVLGVINLESAAPNAYTRDPQRNVDQHREREGDTLS
jgi:sigma-B regulation protein RsbU (phosphoserine phosphatase)